MVLHPALTFGGTAEANTFSVRICGGEVIHDGDIVNAEIVDDSHNTLPVN